MMEFPSWKNLLSVFIRHTFFDHFFSIILLLDMRFHDLISGIFLILHCIHPACSYRRALHALSSFNRHPVLTTLLASSVTSSAHSNKAAVIEVSGMKCMGCASRVQRALQSLDPFVNVDFQSKRAFLNIGKEVLDDAKLMEINSALRIEGDYVASIPSSSIRFPTMRHLLDTFTVFAPLIAVITSIAGGTLYFQKSTFPQVDWLLAMRHFMGLFFIVFSSLKFLNLQGFVDSFRQYDVITRRYTWYGFAYPFIELLLGISYLSKYKFLSASATNLITTAVMSFTTVGVVGVLRSPGAVPLQCACLGSVFRLPMTQVTLVENTAMIAMSLIMLIIGKH